MRLKLLAALLAAIAAAGCGATSNTTTHHASAPPVSGQPICNPTSDATASGGPLRVGLQFVCGPALGPTSLTLPSISGTATVGSVLTLVQGTFSGATSQNGFWQDCPTATSTLCTGSTTGSTYTVQPGDAGLYIRLQETGINSSGSTTVYSNAIGLVTTAGTLNWTPPGYPSYSGYTTVNVTQAMGAPSHTTTQINMPVGQNTIINLPSTDWLGALRLWGGKNVVIIGGHITVPSTANQGDNASDGTDVALRIHDITGETTGRIVHIEGVLMDCQNPAKDMCDAINADAPSANLQVENDRTQNLWGTYSVPKTSTDPNTGEHADVIEPWGGLNALDIDHLTGTGDYQGLTIEKELGTQTNSYDLRNFNITLLPIPSALSSISHGGGNMIVMSTFDNSCGHNGPMTLTNAYIDNESGGQVQNGSTVWPHVGASGCPAVVSGTSVTWPALTNITGHITFGPPPGGDFVPSGVAGNSYVSPGYTP